MSEEVQERFEDYLKLEQYIEQLHSQRPTPPSANLTPHQMNIYLMAMLFHIATPRIADPRPEFREQLRQRLLEQLQAENKRPASNQINIALDPFSQNSHETGIE